MDSLGGVCKIFFWLFPFWTLVRKYLITNSNAQTVIFSYSNSFLEYLISLQRLNDNSVFLCKWKCPAHLISLVYSSYKTKTTRRKYIFEPDFFEIARYMTWLRNSQDKGSIVQMLLIMPKCLFFSVFWPSENTLAEIQVLYNLYQLLLVYTQQAVIFFVTKLNSCLRNNPNLLIP